jgi:type VII secretion integral membrane protein EccD
VLLTTAVCAVALLLAALICFGADVPAATGAVAVTVLAFGFLPALPMLAYRLAQLRVPPLPSGPEELKNDRFSVESSLVLARSERADTLLAALVGAIAAIGAAGAVIAAASGGPGLIFCAALGLLMLIRARAFLFLRLRLPLLLAGAGAISAALVFAYLQGSAMMRLALVPALLIAIAAVGVGLGVKPAGRSGSPVPGRLLDVFETLLIVSIVPLAIWSIGLLSWARSLGG